MDKEKDVCEAARTLRGTVLVQLNNPSHLRKFKDSFTQGAQKWFPAKLITPNGASWEVQYDGTGQKETLGISDIQHASGGKRVKIADPQSLEPFQAVSAKKSDELRMHLSVFEGMNREFGRKQVHLGPSHLVQERSPSG